MKLISIHFYFYLLMFGLFKFIDTIDIDISDVANFPAILTEEFRERVVRNVPEQIKIIFPKSDGRSFSASYYTKQMPNAVVIG